MQPAISPSKIIDIFLIQGLHGLRMNKKHITLVNMQKAIDLLQYRNGYIEEVEELRDAWWPNTPINRKKVAVGARKVYKVSKNGTIPISLAPYEHGDKVTVTYTEQGPIFS